MRLDLGQIALQFLKCRYKMNSRSSYQLLHFCFWFISLHFINMTRHGDGQYHSLTLLLIIDSPELVQTKVLSIERLPNKRFASLLLAFGCYDVPNYLYKVYIRKTQSVYIESNFWLTEWQTFHQKSISQVTVGGFEFQPLTPTNLIDRKSRETGEFTVVP